eukprot:GHVS01028879.1.p1 GENE.GHVS01028879.1~~GHVS01028879.1.p1  ORF type:complete len:198 (-),score=7.17 GHVS01028879.1:434-970(-)
MGRHLLILEVTPKGFPRDKIRLMTTHLESMKEQGKERAKQYRCLIQRMTESTSCNDQNSFVTSICGGDLNMRDKEVSECGMPDNVKDVWTHLGSPGRCKFTWDTYKNTNKEMSGTFKPRYRFDRIYVCQKGEKAAAEAHAPEGWRPISMTLVGVEKIESCEMFPSDHFGLDVVFKREA